jgi:hypothetical protein
MNIMPVTMKIPTHFNQLTGRVVFCIGLAGTVWSLSSCAPNPVLQEQMEQDILTAAEERKAGDSAGSQQGRGSRAWGYGGF